MDDRVHVDNRGVERRWWHWHVGLGQTTRVHGGRGGRERERWGSGGVVVGEKAYIFYNLENEQIGAHISVSQNWYQLPVCIDWLTR